MNSVQRKTVLITIRAAVLVAIMACFAGCANPGGQTDPVDNPQPEEPSSPMNIAFNLDGDFDGVEEMYSVGDQDLIITLTNYTDNEVYYFFNDGEKQPVDNGVITITPGSLGKFNDLLIVVVIDGRIYSKPVKIKKNEWKEK